MPETKNLIKRRCPLCGGWLYLKKNPVNKIENIWDCVNCVHFFQEEYFKIFQHMDKRSRDMEKYYEEDTA